MIQKLTVHKLTKWTKWTKKEKIEKKYSAASALKKRGKMTFDRLCTYRNERKMKDFC
jgi:hypothetical protein